MSGALNSLIGAFVAGQKITVTERSKTTSSTSGTSLTSNAINFLPGRIYLVMLAWDPSGNAVPTVTVNDNSTGIYTALAAQQTAPATTTAGGGVITQTFIVSSSTSFSTTVFATFSAAVANKVMTVIELSGATTTQRNTATSSRGTTVAPNYASPSGNQYDMILTIVAQETNSAGAPTAGSASTTGGTWSAISNNFTTGGNAATNIGLSYQYKLLTTTGAQTNAWTMGSTANWASQSFAISAA